MLQSIVLEGAKIRFLEDFDIICATHNSIDLMKPSHPLSCDTAPHHDVSSPVFDGFWTKQGSRARLESCVLAAIGLEQQEFWLIQENDPLPHPQSPILMLLHLGISLYLVGWTNVGARLMDLAMSPCSFSSQDTVWQDTPGNAHFTSSVALATLVVASIQAPWQMSWGLSFQEWPTFGLW